mgnify:CR=1 FL=1
MVNKKVLLMMAVVLLTALMLGSLALRGTVSSEAQTTANPDMSIYLNIWGIQGESQETNHMGWIDVGAFNWSEAVAAMIAGRAAGVVSIKDFVFVAQTNMASPKLFLAVATGRIIPNATLECWTGGETTQAKFLEFKLNNVVITSYNIVGNAEDYRPLDQFSIAFSKITMTYWLINPDGSQGSSITAYYDLMTHRGG